MRCAEAPPTEPELAARTRRRAGLLAFAAGAGALYLVLFHAALLWERLADASIVRPEVGARWLAAALLMAAGARLVRRGSSLLRGRQALAIWLLSFLLHTGVTPPEHAALPLPAPPPATLHLLWMVPLAAGAGDGRAAFGRLLALLRRQLEAARRSLPLAQLALAPGARASSPSRFPLLAPRPPPARAVAPQPI